MYNQMTIENMATVFAPAIFNDDVSREKKRRDNRKEKKGSAVVHLHQVEIEEKNIKLQISHQKSFNFWKEQMREKEYSEFSHYSKNNFLYTSY